MLFPFNQQSNLDELAADPKFKALFEQNIYSLLHAMGMDGDYIWNPSTLNGILHSNSTVMTRVLLSLGKLGYVDQQKEVKATVMACLVQYTVGLTDALLKEIEIWDTL